MATDSKCVSTCVIEECEDNLLNDAVELAKDNVIQSELSLKRLAMVQVAKNFWDAEWLKKLLVNKLTHCVDWQDMLESIRFDMIIEGISSQCDTLHLPPPLQKLKLPTMIKNDLVEMVEEMGIQLPSLFREIFSRLKNFDEAHRESAFQSYVYNIQWTDTGRIDYGKTGKRALDDMEFANEFMKYSEICRDCLEDEIEKWHVNRRIRDKQDPIMEQIQPIDLRKIRYDEVLYRYLMAYWHFRYEERKIDSTMSDFLSYYRHYDSIEYWVEEKEGSIELNSFLLCLSRDHKPGINYFWSQIDETSRNNYFPHVLRRVSWKSQGIEDYGPMMDIRFSILRKMSVHRCSRLLEFLHREYIDTHALISLYTNSWRDFSLPSLEILFKYLFTNREGYFMKFIESLCCDVWNERYFEFHVRSRQEKTRELILEVLKTFFEILRTCWIENDPGIIKKQEFIYTLLQTEDMLLIKTLIDHEGLQDIRPHFLSYAADCFSLALNTSGRGCRFREIGSEVCERFKREVLQNDDERRDFSREVHYRKSLMGVLKYP